MNWHRKCVCAVLDASLQMRFEAVPRVFRLFLSMCKSDSHDLGRYNKRLQYCAGLDYLSTILCEASVEMQRVTSCGTLVVRMYWPTRIEGRVLSPEKLKL